MSISNSTLALQLQEVAAGWRGFVEQQIEWLTLEVPTITITDPYNAGIVKTIKTIWQIQQDYDALFDPASGALGQISQLLIDAQVILDDAAALSAQIGTYNTDFLNYRDQAQAAATAAEVARDAAQLAETNAETAEANAGASAGASSASATAADGSAQAAAASASAASQSATDAAASAAAAAASAATFVEGVTINANPTRATSVEFVGSGVQSVSQTGSAVTVTITGGGGTGITDGDKGDVTVSAGGTAWTIDAGVVNTTKLGGDILSFMKSFLSAANVAAARTALGLGSAAIAASTDFATAAHTHGTAIASGAAGFMSGTDKFKLDGIQAGATANSTDAFLRARLNHTGTQPVSTITGLAALATSGSASDLGSGTVPVARLGSSGTRDATTVLYGDNVWRVPASASIQFGDTNTNYTAITRSVFVNDWTAAGSPYPTLYPVSLQLDITGADATIRAGLTPVSADLLSDLILERMGGSYQSTVGIDVLRMNPEPGSSFTIVGTLLPSSVGLTEIDAASSAALRYLRINAAGTGLEWSPVSGGGGGLPPDGVYGDIGVTLNGTTWVIQQNAISGPELAADSVSTSKIGNDQVTFAKIGATGTKVATPGEYPWHVYNIATGQFHPNLPGPPKIPDQNGAWAPVMRTDKAWISGHQGLVLINDARNPPPRNPDGTGGDPGLEFVGLGSYVYRNQSATYTDGNDRPCVGIWTRGETTAGVGGAAWGGVFEAAASGSSVNADLIGIEVDCVALRDNSNGSKVGVSSIFFNRRSGQLNTAIPVGDNKYNANSIGLLINSFPRSPSGEYCGFERGIWFRRFSLDQSVNLPKAIGIDFYGTGPLDTGENGAINLDRAHCIKFPNGEVLNGALDQSEWNAGLSNNSWGILTPAQLAAAIQVHATQVAPPSLDGGVASDILSGFE